MRVVAILTAAGSGSRLGRAEPKALVRLGGRPLVLLAAQALLDGGVEHLVVTAPDGAVARVEDLLRGLPADVVPGGPSRQASVAAGLARLAARAGELGIDDSSVVLVHDAARPTVPPDLVTRVAEAAAERGAAVPGVPLADTVKRVGPAQGSAAPVLGTPERATLRAVQTPQGFGLGLLVRAHAAAAALADDESTAATDDAALVEALGERVWVVPGDERARKITTAGDLALAELLLEG